MAPVKRRGKERTKFDFKIFLNWLKSLFLEPKNGWVIAALLFCAEIIVNIAVIWKIRCKL